VNSDDSKLINYILLKSSETIHSELSMVILQYQKVNGAH